MYSKEHFALSAALGAAVAVLADAPYGWRALVAYAAVVGTAIDLDHFALSRLNTGDWRALRKCVRDPYTAFVAQDTVFDGTDLLPLQRIFSHLLVAGVLVSLLWTRWPFLAGVTALVLYAHVVSDLAWDHFHLDETNRKHAQHLDGTED